MKNERVGKDANTLKDSIIFSRYIVDVSIAVGIVKLLFVQIFVCKMNGKIIFYLI